MSTEIYTGMEARIGAMWEVPYGTPQTGSISWIGIVTSVEPSVSKSLIPIKALGRGRDTPYLMKGRRIVENRIEYYPQNCTFLNAMYCADSGSTIEICYAKTGFGANQYLYLVGSKCNSFTVRGAVGEPTKIETTLWSKYMITRTTATGSSSIVAADAGTDPYMWFDGNVSGSTAVTKWHATSYSVTVNQNLERAFTLDADDVLRNLPELKREINGEVTFYFTGSTEFTQLVGDTADTMHITMASGKIMQLYGTKWASTSYPTTPENLVVLRIPFNSRSGSFPT